MKRLIYQMIRSENRVAALEFLETDKKFLNLWSRQNPH